MLMETDEGLNARTRKLGKGVWLPCQPAATHCLMALSSSPQTMSTGNGLSQEYGANTFSQFRRRALILAHLCLQAC